MFLIKYIGNLRTEALHKMSGIKIKTDAPIDNHGKGEMFSPTDLLSVSLGSCIITIMGIKAQSISKELEEKLKGTEIEIKKIMSIDLPRRVSKIKVILNIPFNPSKEEKEILEIAGLSCPVSKSLNSEIEQVIKFNWKE